MDMDLKTRIEVLPCGKCEDMLDCDTCIFSKEAKELYKQTRTEVIEEFANILCSESLSDYAIDIIRHWEKKLKENK